MDEIQINALVYLLTIPINLMLWWSVFRLSSKWNGEDFWSFMPITKKEWFDLLFFLMWGPVTTMVMVIHLVEAIADRRNRSKRGR